MYLLFRMQLDIPLGNAQSLDLPTLDGPSGHVLRLMMCFDAKVLSQL